MLDLYVLVLTMMTVFLLAAGLAQIGKVPEMPAFYKRMIKEGIFNKLMLKNYDIRKKMHFGRIFPEIQIENVCGLYDGMLSKTE